MVEHTVAVLRVEERHHGVERQARVAQSCDGGTRFGGTTGLDHDQVRPHPFEQRPDRAGEARLLDLAADAPTGEFDGPVDPVEAAQHATVDIESGDFIDDHCDPSTEWRPEQAAHERRLAAA